MSRGRRPRKRWARQPRRGDFRWRGRSAEDFTWSAGIAVTALIAAVVTAWYGLTEYRYWGEPEERGRVVEIERGGWFGHGKSSCDGADFTLAVSRPRPGFPDAVRVRECASTWDLGDPVRFSRRADQPGKGMPDVVPPSGLPVLFVVTFAAVGALLALVVVVQRRPWKTARRVRAGR